MTMTYSRLCLSLLMSCRLGLLVSAQTQAVQFNQVINLNGDMTLNSLQFPDNSKIETFSQKQQQIIVNQNPNPLSANHVVGSSGQPFVQLSANSMTIQTNSATDLVGAQIEMSIDPNILSQMKVTADNTFVAQLSTDRQAWVILEGMKSVNTTDNTVRMVKLNSIDGEFMAVGRQTVETGTVLTTFGSGQTASIAGSGIQEVEFTDGFRMSIKASQSMVIKADVKNGISSSMVTGGAMSLNNYRYLVTSNLAGVQPNLNSMVAVVQLPLNAQRIMTMALAAGAQPGGTVNLGVAQRVVLQNPGGSALRRRQATDTEEDVATEPDTQEAAAATTVAAKASSAAGKASGVAKSSAGAKASSAAKAAPSADPEAEAAAAEEAADTESTTSASSAEASTTTDAAATDAVTAAAATDASTTTTDAGTTGAVSAADAMATSSMTTSGATSTDASTTGAVTAADAMATSSTTTSGSTTTDAGTTGGVTAAAAATSSSSSGNTTSSSTTVAAQQQAAAAATTTAVLGLNPQATPLLLSPTFAAVPGTPVLDMQNGRIAVAVNQIDGEFIVTMAMPGTAGTIAAAPGAPAGAAQPAVGGIAGKRQAAPLAASAGGTISMTMEQLGEMVMIQKTGGAMPVWSMMNELMTKPVGASLGVAGAAAAAAGPLKQRSSFTERRATRKMWP